MSGPDHDVMRIRAVDAAFALFVFAVTLYFAHYAIQGAFGLFALMDMRVEEASLAAELAALRAERAELELLSGSLSAVAPDLDLLDERSRQALGLMHADEIILR